MTGHGGGPPPPVPRGDGPGPKESLSAPARAVGRGVVGQGRGRAGAGRAGTVGRAGPGSGVGSGRRSGVLAPGRGRRASVRVRAQAGRSGGGSGAAGLTSRVGAEGRLPPAAAGRRGIPRRSISWSCTETTAFAAAIRSGAGAAPSQARSPRSAAILRRRRTIWPGNEALARLNTTPLRAALRDRLLPSVAGYDFSMYGTASLCTAKPTPRKAPKKPSREALTRKPLSAKLAPRR